MKIKTGKDVKKLLIDLDMTQSDLAEALDLSLKTVNSMCRAMRIKLHYAYALDHLVNLKMGVGENAKI